SGAIRWSSSGSSVGPNGIPTGLRLGMSTSWSSGTTSASTASMSPEPAVAPPSPPSSAESCCARKYRRAEARLNVGTSSCGSPVLTYTCPDDSPMTMPPDSGGSGAGLNIPKMMKPSTPRALSTTPTMVALEWVRIGSCSMTASLRTSADCILRSTNLYAWTCDFVVGFEGIVDLVQCGKTRGSNTTRVVRGQALDDVPGCSRWLRPGHSHECDPVSASSGYLVSHRPVPNTSSTLPVTVRCYSIVIRPPPGVGMYLLSLGCSTQVSASWPSSNERG